MRQIGLPLSAWRIWNDGNRIETWLVERLHSWGPRRLYLLNYLLPFCQEANRKELAGLIGEARALRSWRP